MTKNQALKRWLGRACRACDMAGKWLPSLVLFGLLTAAVPQLVNAMLFGMFIQIF